MEFVSLLIHLWKTSCTLRGINRWALIGDYNTEIWCSPAAVWWNIYLCGSEIFRNCWHVELTRQMFICLCDESEQLYSEVTASPLGMWFILLHILLLHSTVPSTLHLGPTVSSKTTGSLKLLTPRFTAAITALTTPTHRVEWLVKICWLGNIWTDFSSGHCLLCSLLLFSTIQSAEALAILVLLKRVKLSWSLVIVWCLSYGQHQSWY